jgi:tRNA nucleotidyltransferase (CCA-adding enzyme)
MLEISLNKFLELIPSYVINIAEELQKNGYEAYLVGGSLRDVLLGKVPSDFDVATNAYPDQIIAIFPRSIPTGAKFGTITVIGEDEAGERFDVEVTTYRSEADYVGGRWPTKIEFAKTIQDDLSRRDFTINAMALNLQEFDTHAADEKLVQDLIIDPFGGLADLESKTIRAVREPLERFTEDGLRPVRGCRLAAQLGFTIEPKTLAAMSQSNHVTQHISVERFREELMKLLYKSAKPSVGLRLMQETGILKLFIPELEEGLGIEQPEFHVEDVFSHTLSTVDKAEDDVKLAALFHDVGKPRTRSQDEHGTHFYGHDQVGAEMTAEIMRRLKFPTAEIHRTVKLVRWHMFYYPSADWRKLKKEDFDWSKASKEEIAHHLEQSRTKKSKGGWSDGAIRRLIQNVGGEENVEDLMKLRVADATSNTKSDFNPEEITILSQRISEVRAQEMALKVTDLDIDGQALMQAFGIEPGPRLGEVLAYLLEQVVEDPALNTRETLLSLAGRYLDGLGG